MTKPYQFQVNLNGDSAVTLTQQYRDASTAVNDAIEQICQARPHGRNYQTCEPEIFYQDAEQFDADLVVLNKIRERLLQSALKAIEATR